MDDNVSDLDRLLGTVPPAEIDTIVSSVISDEHFDVQREVRQRLPYNRRASINDIISEEYQNRLMEIDYTISNCYWMIGDITNDIINSLNRTRAQELGKVISKTDIYEAVGVFCHRSARQVRYYWECARWFPPEVRRKYNVPFAVFAEARWIDNWELVLKLAEQNPMWSAERVRAEYLKLSGMAVPDEQSADKEGSAVPEVSAETVVDETGSAIPEVLLDEYRKSGTRESRAVLLSTLERTLDGLRDVLDKMLLPTDIRIRIGEVLLEIQDIGLQIRREM